MKNDDPKHKLWFIFDNNLVLPEYLVEFDYVKSNSKATKVTELGDSLGFLDTN